MILRCSNCQSLFESEWKADELQVQCDRCTADPEWRERERLDLLRETTPSGRAMRAWDTRRERYGPSGHAS